MARELSTKWWNVIRRKLRATKVTYVEPVACPDCDAPAHLQEGRYGRYYACDRYWCSGSRGARLDGTPTCLRGDPETQAARVQTARAVGALLSITNTHDYKALYRHILSTAGPMTPILDERPRKAQDPFAHVVYQGLMLKHRGIEDLRRLEAAARTLFREFNACYRRSAWDFVGYADDEGTLPVKPRPESAFAPFF
jgi:hypothetical protein